MIKRARKTLSSSVAEATSAGVQTIKITDNGHPYTVIVDTQRQNSIVLNDVQWRELQTSNVAEAMVDREESIVVERTDPDE